MRTRTVGSSTSLLPLINAGHVSSIWHDILLIPPPPSPASGSSSPPRHPSVSPFPTSAFSFVCLPPEIPLRRFCGSRKLRRRDDPLFLLEKRMVVMALDGSLTKVQTSPSSALLLASPWNLGILPQTCVLASRSMSMFSRWDATGDSGGSDGRQDNELTDSLLTACDNAPLEALEIGSQARDPGDVYDVFPLLAMPLRLLGSGRNSMPISWRIVTIAADDELVTSGQLKHSMRDLLDRVREWAKKSESFGEIVGPGRSPNLCFGAFPSPSPAEAENREAGESQSGLQDSRIKSNERGAWGGGSGGVGRSLRRISRIKGRYSKVEHEKRGVDEAEEEEWGKTAREADEKEQVEKAARQAWEAEETETAAEQREQAREAVHAVLYAHSTWRILCPTLRRPALKRLENRHCGSSHLPEKGHGSSHLPENHHDGSHLPGKQQQQQQEEEERQDRLFRSPVISRHMSSALPLRYLLRPHAPGGRLIKPAKADPIRICFRGATGVWRLISPPESYGLPGLVSAGRLGGNGEGRGGGKGEERGGEEGGGGMKDGVARRETSKHRHRHRHRHSHDFTSMIKNSDCHHNSESSGRLAVSAAKVAAAAAAAVEAVKTQVVTGVAATAAAVAANKHAVAGTVARSVARPFTHPAHSFLLSPSHSLSALTLKLHLPPRSPPLTPSSRSHLLTPSSRSPPLTPSSRSPPLTPSSRSPHLTFSTQSPPFTPSQSPPLPPSSQSPPLPPSSQSPPLPPSSQSPPLPPSSQSPLTPLPLSPPLTPLSQSPPLTLSHSSTVPPSPPARRYSVQSGGRTSTASSPRFHSPFARPSTFNSASTTAVSPTCASPCAGRSILKSASTTAASPGPGKRVLWNLDPDASPAPASATSGRGSTLPEGGGYEPIVRRASWHAGTSAGMRAAEIRSVDTGAAMAAGAMGRPAGNIFDKIAGEAAECSQGTMAIADAAGAVAARTAARAATATGAAVTAAAFSLSSRPSWNLPSSKRPVKSMSSDQGE
ncbi:unnamed protein product [Closterium sp. NIES-53]